MDFSVEPMVLLTLISDNHQCPCPPDMICDGSGDTQWEPFAIWAKEMTPDMICGWKWRYTTCLTEDDQGSEVCWYLINYGGVSLSVAPPVKEAKSTGELDSHEWTYMHHNHNNNSFLMLLKCF